MSYKTYTTEALVCGSANHNTSDKNYLLFSKEAGMVWATARSVREERSKQRCALQDFSHIRVSLVKGKSGWRIGSVEALGNPFLSAESRIERGTVNYVVTQLRKYVHGEVQLLRVYEDAFELLFRNNEDVQVTERRIAEQLFLARLLHELGYIAPLPSWAEVIQAKTLREAVAAYTPAMDALIVAAVQEGKTVSHL